MDQKFKNFFKELFECLIMLLVFHRVCYLIFSFYVAFLLPSPPLTLEIIEFLEVLVFDPLDFFDWGSLLLFHKIRSKTLAASNLPSFHAKINKIKDNFYLFCTQKMVDSKFSMNFINSDKITIFGVEFVYDSKNNRYKLSKDKVLDAIDLICIVNALFKDMEIINVRGYVRVDTLTNNFMSEISKHLFGLGFEKKVIGNAELTYTMWYNFLFLFLYYLVVRELRSRDFHKLKSKTDDINLILQSLDINGLNKVEEVEVLYELDFLKDKLHSRLDQFVKSQIGNRGIGIVQNTYTGFDTEYESVKNSDNKNLLLSVQTAVQRRTILKVPCVDPYDIGYVHPITSEISDTFSSKVGVRNPHKYTFVEEVVGEVEKIDHYYYKNGILMKKKKDRRELNEILILNNSIKLGICLVREMLYKCVDEFNSGLVKKLSSLRGVEGFEGFDFYKDPKRNQFIFFFPLTVPELKIAFPKGDFTFGDLLEMSKTETKFSHELELYTEKSLPSPPSDTVEITGKNKPTTPPVITNVVKKSQISNSIVNYSNSSNSSKNLAEWASLDSISTCSICSTVVESKRDLVGLGNASTLSTNSTSFSHNPTSKDDLDLCSKATCVSSRSRVSNLSKVIKVKKFSKDSKNSSTSIVSESESTNFSNVRISDKSSLLTKNSSDSSSSIEKSVSNFCGVSSFGSCSPSSAGKFWPFTQETVFNIFRGGKNKIKDVYSGWCGGGGGGKRGVCLITNQSNQSNQSNLLINPLVDLLVDPQLDTLDSHFNFICRVFEEIGVKEQNVLGWYQKSKLKLKSLIRRRIELQDNSKQTITITRNNYLIGHYNAADLSMLSDFDSIKEKLSIVGKSFLTLGLPLKCQETNVYIRDTIKLAPNGKGRLEDLGELYKKDGDFGKRSIKKEYLEEMSKLLKEDKNTFIEYGVQDAKITLKHAVKMEEFNRSVKQLGIPTTLSSIGRYYVATKWVKNFDKHLPYQISGEFLMGNASDVQTPKGLFATKDVGVHMSYYIANYKGGRNESFMYGCDENTHWYDYDLVSAYTTGMADIPLPDYHNAYMVDPGEVNSWTDIQLLTGFLSVNCIFEFPKSTKYPSIPCYVDKTTTVYPLTGEAFLTGPEFLLARNQDADIQIKSAFYIAPKEQYDTIKKEKVTIKPFHEILKGIQALRKQYPKGHINNLMYKEIGNGIYGNVCRGISNKKAFDALTKSSVSVTATKLSNPIIGAWTTAFIRSVVGECLHNLQKLGGRVVSVTTDGFITDLDKLEQTLLMLPPNETYLLRKYRSIRTDLSGISEALEVKTCGTGILSWTTRGQMGIDSRIIATTGFQKGGYEKKELVEIFKDTLKNENKFFEFTAFSLRGAKDIFEKGGHVTPIRKEQTFRLFHDNRRTIKETYQMKKSDNSFWNLSKVLLDSEPLKDKNHCKTLRFLSKFPITLPYNKQSANKSRTKYKSNLDVGIRNFIKAYYSTTKNFGLKGNEFRYIKDLITFIYGHKPTNVKNISISSISHLKNRKMVWKPVPNTKENLEFVKYIKEKYPYFESERFLKSKD